MKDNFERRYYEPEIVQLRAIKEEDGKRFVEGYAAVFGKKSQLLFNYERGEVFYEIVERDAFNEVLSDPNLDVTLNFQHDDNYLIARTATGSLQISTDDVGLKIRSEIPNTSYANDIYELINRGELRMSFAFLASNEDYRWGEFEDDIAIGYLTNVRRLLDTSFVVRPAYKDTEAYARSEVATRSYEAYLESNKQEDEEPKEDFSLEGESRKRKLNIKK